MAVYCLLRLLVTEQKMDHIFYLIFCRPVIPLYFCSLLLCQLNYKSSSLGNKNACAIKWSIIIVVVIIMGRIVQYITFCYNLHQPVLDQVSIGSQDVEN